MSEKVATSLLQAIVVTIPFWFAVVKFFVDRVESNDEDFIHELVLMFLVFSVVSLGGALLGIYDYLSPLNQDLKTSFIFLIIWFVSTGFLIALPFIESIADWHTLEFNEFMNKLIKLIVIPIALLLFFYAYGSMTF